MLRPEAAGDLVAHSGKVRRGVAATRLPGIPASPRARSQVLHAGEAVTAGVRDILVGFVAVTGEAVNQNFLASTMVTAACEHPRLDVAIVNGALVATAL